MSYNSTIKPKMAICPLCTGTNKVPTTKGFCQRHYWEQNKLKSALKAQERELEQDEDLQILVSDLDIIFSRFIRLKGADLYGNCECVTCGATGNWKMMDCGHFIPRAHMYTRFSEDNCYPQCHSCNRINNGNMATFAVFLETIKPGSVEILQEQARIIHKWSREELKAMIADYTRKLKQVQKNILA
jgi:hypothetical protein